MKINKKQITATFMTAVLAGSIFASSAAIADVNSSNTGSPEEQADITNWIANTPEQISNNMAMQHINTNNLDGTRYIIQWGDTLAGISSATGISVPKLCYYNNIHNANLIFAGNVLILNRQGTVPTDYHPDINPYAVAQTKVTINNGPTTVNIAVQPQSIVNNYDQSDNSDHSKTIYKAVENDSTNNAQDDSQSNEEKDSSKSSSNNSEKTSKKQSSSISASDIVDGLNDANKMKNWSFDEGDGEGEADELDIDSDALLKAAKKDDYDSILDEIKDALGSKAKKDITIYIEKDGKEIHVYASINDDDSDSSKDDQDSSNSKSDSTKDKSDSSEDEDSSSSDSSQNDDDNDNQANTNNDQDDDNASDDE